MTPEQIKHMEMIQSIITRMNTNSFQIKGFSVAIITALLAVYSRTLNFWLIPIGYPTIVLFWIIDSYYLQHERKFRGLYNDIVATGWNEGRPVFNMNISKYTGKGYQLIESMFVSINSFIYLAMIALFSILIAIIK